MGINWLKEIRDTLQMTQAEIAEKVGVQRAYYGMIELGIRRPSPEVAMRIAGALGFDWTRFYTEEIKAEPEGR